MATGQDLIDNFNVQVDDSSELSDDEALDLLNDVYEDVCNDRDWEWLKVQKSDTTSTTVPYVALPADFKKLTVNENQESVVFVGTQYQEYKVIPFSNRRTYRNQDGYCYIDVPNSRLVFTLQPTSAQAIEYDYIKNKTDLTLTTSPIFRSGFHKVIFFGMAARFPQIEQANKLTSYAQENQGLYLNTLHDMAVEDALIKLSI